MQSNLAYNEYYTKEDYKLWEGDWELIYGNAYSMAPSPVYGHQFVNGQILWQLKEKLKECKKCNAVFEMDVEFSEDTIVRPDCIVICYEPIDRLAIAPEIVFEVVSKNSAKRDEILKFELYQNEGVKYYIIVYPESKKAKVYKLKDAKYQKEGDFSKESYTFKLEECEIEFDFDFIWRR
jgi:Uma2 family endonuclease